MLKKEEKTEITKAKIFAAAMIEFGTNGYKAGSINNICKSGINKGLIYHNFKDKDELYLECVKKSCTDLMRYVIDNDGRDGFVAYMSARMRFFKEHESEACIFLEARTNPPRSLKDSILPIFTEFDELNREIFEKELFNYELRDNVSKEDALSYFMEIQKVYNFNFASEINGKMSPQEQWTAHERNLHKVLELMLYGIAKGGNML